MKTRENELHEPTVEILRSGNVTTTLAVLCSVCGNQILATTGHSRDNATVLARTLTPNYCPYCGARLKEV